ncbi:Pkinase-domain-containing protein [Meira miltonrushii]|uniref:Pkinase-domain-containing protein n=1 Tax=Meira miltonrushii TaxID=1280837 RepID=A0A316VA16_9BASI|nr:Pkinase-domain-containing protein [Meira miltonrushii]PWN34310.1 Pkinase-domain-containing protein [Meira miltonrushii]
MSGGLSPRRPILTLNIETPPSLSSAKLLENASVSPESSSAGPGFHPTPSPGTSGLGRQPSFARRERGDWAFRPPPEQLYENLDDFFPKHDLDKPVIDPNASAGSMNSPTTAASPARSRMQHKKSIRIVAQDRKKLLDKVEAAEQRKTGATDLSRRRSTKLWGGKVIEVTPGTEAASNPNVADSPTSTTSNDGQKPVFKWVKGDLIGKGTYGRVYLALNATTGEMIAVKQVELPRTASDREDNRQKGVVAALKSEIETLKDLDHPNIVSYLGFEETRSNLSIFLEYVPGGSVGSCLRKHGKLDESTIKSFLQQILNGLNYLHGRGILHRDLKADNLLVDFNGIVKISDFGTVRKSEDIYGNVASMSMQGSIFWMAPEVLSRAGYSAKVDIWSLGCVVLEMFAGRRPWSDEEAVQAMFKIGAERRAPPIPPDVRLSKAAAHFLKICFAVDPNERPTASRLLAHVFPHAENGWQFSMSSLYRQLHR